ncbi:CPBP family intramembrane metalloprotease [Gemmata sp. JC673]|uniref:CPBP family intramembrane metalloprotease n=1 Tax=Gemmata algarum TaxID=2975278 RepID=A0ABU5EWA5_9BACT|nr:type II CAAX endopeptidase family protein [Gemmata algarum]MDY3559581.1 CPBP family intramembrane metalloprotease [Gemmata algarum]
MSEPTNEPPLVTRTDLPLVAPVAPAQTTRPRPGLLEAVVWCGLFVATQLLGAIIGTGVVFGALMYSAADPKAFADEQLDGFGKAVDLKSEGERSPIPDEIGRSLASGMLAAQFASLGLILLVLPRRIGPDWARQIGLRRPHPLHVFLALLLVPAFMICADLIQTLFLWATGMKPPPVVKALNGVFGSFPWPLTALAVAVGPGVVEELWCRGFLGRGLCARYGIPVGVLFTAVLFAAMHLDPSQLVVITLMGLYLHFVYLAARSIWVPILLHATNNGLAILLALVLKVGDSQGNVEVPLAVHVLAFSLLLFGSVALWTSRAEIVPVRGAGNEPWQPESAGVSAPPDGVKMRLVYVAFSPAAVLCAVASFGALAVLLYQLSR